MKISKLSIVLSAVIQTMFLNAQQVDKTAFGSRLYQESDKVLPYRYLLPEGYDAADRATKYPLILILHGSGERGNNNSSQLYDFLSVFQQDNIREEYKAMVVLPQCPANRGFGDTPLRGLIGALQKIFAIDANRLYVGGLSMGGYGTYEIVSQNPGLFAAAFPICAWWDDMTVVPQMTTPDWWLFHGDQDPSVAVTESRKMAQALTAAGASVQLTIYPGVQHNSWDRAFAEPNLIPWLFSKSLNRFPTSVADHEQPELFLYPNPARGTVTLCGLKSGETISIMDVKGNIRMTFKAAGETENIPAGGLSQGIYIVQTVKNGKTKTVKLYVD
ncbi:MAG: T9SS type A sorting domain-containing protein [Bacteroidales bacterium]|jgi:predicted peptidase|nr:T9SS type A sorting domain-containing protein [Bacteroidales bacterium]